jgi:hypothetical protein|tara:strand:+ start:10125 stop:10301 length:177 start_codon:yes stop_codon:yes gene_type:complete
MTIGYMSGKRVSRNVPKLTAHNQGGGPKKTGLFPQSGYYRQGKANLKIFKSCRCLIYT